MIKLSGKILDNFLVVREISSGITALRNKYDNVHNLELRMREFHSSIDN
jgi:hypothetical protein